MRAAPLPVLFAMLFMTGCSIKQTVTPANLSAELAPEICTIPAVGLRAGFIPPINNFFGTRASRPVSLPRAAARLVAR